MRQLILTVFLFLSFISVLFAQITIETERDSNNNVNFFATNLSSIPYSVILNFSQLQNLTTPGGGNTIAVANPGRTKVATLSPTLAGQGTSYRYSYSYTKGNIYAKSKINPVYLVPVEEGTVVKAVLNNPLEETIGDKSAKGSYRGVSFMFDEPVTIVAPRKGVIADMKMDANVVGENLSFAKEENFIEIYHEDGTFTKLIVLKSGSEKVKVGQQVFPGDVLAESGGENYSQGPHVRMVNLRAVSEKDLLVQEAFPVSFVSDKGNLEVKVYVTFTVVYPEEVVTMEMSKKELKSFQEGK
jgi:murein DD-endopeptidase MepM/ murein hydrolase activator NlpD